MDPEPGTSVVRNVSMKASWARSALGVQARLLVGGVPPGSASGLAATSAPPPQFHDSRVSDDPVSFTVQGLSACQGAEACIAIPNPHDSVDWGGEAIQDPDPLVSGPQKIDPATHPLVTVYLPNNTTSLMPLRIDLVVGSGTPPDLVSGANSKPAPARWPGAIWDWATEHPDNALIVPADRTAVVPLDWPQTDAAGRAVAFGSYWAVVTAAPASDPAAAYSTVQQLILVASLRTLNCLGSPAAPTVSGLPSPFPAPSQPDLSVPASEVTFAGIEIRGTCTLTGPDPEVAVIGFINPTAVAVTFDYDLVIGRWDAKTATAGTVYCDTRDASPPEGPGRLTVGPEGATTVTVGWPHCGDLAANDVGMFVLDVLTEVVPAGYPAESASQVVRVSG